MMGVALVLLYFALAIFAAAIILQSDRFAVRRSATIGAEASSLFDRLSDPARWASLGAASVVESRPNELVVLRLVSGKTESLATVELQPEGNETLVDCVVTGRNSLADKARNLLASREKVLGPKIEKALADLGASA